MLFQHTAARRRLVLYAMPLWANRGFNTQPPEGGWCLVIHFDQRERCFNTQPPEGGW